MNAKFSDWGITIIRVLVGYMFMMAGWRKVSAGSDWIPRMQGFINRHIEGENVYGFFLPFLEGVVLKVPALFAYMVAYGELLVGLALIVGALTRLSAFFGIVMMASFLFTKGHSLTFLSASNYDTLWIFLFALLLFSGAGRVLGVDRFLRSRFGERRWLW